MTIRVVAPDPTWRAKFEGEADQIAGVLGGVVTAIHHIGSTSIPGIFAKPVIDIVLEVVDVNALDGISDGMEFLGYEGMGEFGIKGRRYFRRDDLLGARTHQVHAFVRGDPQVQRHLAFRDYLIAHPEIAAAYSTLKRELADQHPDDMEAHMDGKDPFIKEQEAKALAWCARY
jgi:GrpB-like predicted nucleotidyltransferase (UPF0157 family)